jgi:hypothetical protein
LAGRRIAIHAAKKWDVSALQLADRYLTAAQIQQTWQFRDHGRNIIGTAFVSCHRELSAEDSAGALIDCGATKRYGLILESPMAITPILCKGKQGIWYYEIPA